MSYEEDKLISAPEVVLIIILSLIGYAGSVFLFFKPIAGYFYYHSPPIDSPCAKAFFIILVLNIVWSILIWKSLLMKNKRAKIYLSALVYTLSASVLSCFIVATMLKGAFA